jgi:hypothetical protein
MRAAREDDPNRQMMAGLFGTLRDVIGVGNRKTAAEIIWLGCSRVTENEARGHGDEQSGLLYPDLHDALITVAGRSGEIDGRELGKWLSRNPDRQWCAS